MREKITKQAKIVKQHGGFGLEILLPGQALGRQDSGLGTIGRIDHANITPGTLIAMHPHRDDEILTYLRSGRVQHKDSEVHADQISPTHLMLMNAGALIQHEELSLVEGGLLKGLQIFFRPERSGLPPQVQFATFPQAVSVNSWRQIAGKDASFPLRVRSDSWLFDLRLEKGVTIELPELPAAATNALIYLFAGELSVDAVDTLREGESLLVAREPARLTALETSDIVLFVTNVAWQFAVNGMYSGDLNRYQ